MLSYFLFSFLRTMCRNLNTHVLNDSYTYLIIVKLIVLVCFLEEFLTDLKSLRI